ncbi:MAG: MotA/TolQ/ExbB proton channel family protein [Lachnospiraceae bacterium]|nr:MotA/TolQ/ExbB proton channel family protein [Lachnospiraceae bacterium]
MKGRKLYEWLLTVTYLGMVAVCVYLNVFSSQKEGLASIIVNGIMFAIVGVVFLACEFGCFRPVNSMIVDLKKVAGKIRVDAMNSHQFLWMKYDENDKGLFTDQTLKREFNDYMHELNRISHIDNAYYKCDIEDYINYELMDKTIHRNQLNQVAGVMTGLGILGTFIGLSLGLQSFSTGTTAEITNSIAPLMSGIKVAFHTSIYGMVFSLVFNYVFKRKLDEAETAVAEFLNMYKKYVLPDTTTDGINKLMELQEQQTNAINSLANTVAHQLSQGLADLLEPQFDRFDKTITSFGMMATRNQLDALSVVVNQFIKEMNKALSNSFNNMADTIAKAYNMQEENARQMEEILQRTGSSATNLREIDNQSQAIVAALDSYTKDIMTVQGEMSKNLVSLQQSVAADSAFLGQERDYMMDLGSYRKALEASAASFNEQLKNQKLLLEDINKLVTRTPESIKETFKVIEDDLVKIETHFRTTINDIQDATERVSGVVNNSSVYLEKAFDRAYYSIEQLTAAVDRMRRSI